MTLVTNSLLESGPTKQTDDENEIVNRLVQAVGEAGLCKDRIETVNVYVALKSKPLSILAGPAQSGKVALVQCLARILMGGDSSQGQVLLGHAWSAGKSGNVTFLTNAQTRLNTEKLMCLIEEAWQPENSGRLFVACLAHISPAELSRFFTVVAYQLRHEQVICFGDAHLNKPIPFPPNLLLIGTMDTDQFDLWDEDLLSKTTIIQWLQKNKNRAPQFEKPRSAVLSGEREFLRSSIRSERTVYRKLQLILKDQRQPFRPLFQIEALLEKYGIQLPRSVLGEAMVYLANAWSRPGIGLFDTATARNLQIALDLAITQTLLPRAVGKIRHSASLYRELSEVFSGKFPRSKVFLETCMQSTMAPLMK